MLTEKQFSRHKSFYQLWFGIIRPVALTKSIPDCRQPSHTLALNKPHPHMALQCLSQSTCVARVALLAHQKNSQPALINTITGTADAVEASSK
ncbi:MAG: hypothetical protein CM15mP103_02490 [Gammaproteobacteria bacterium]|nr:MAG: hypothetical protein CM15mP103_02490 [Gammaproteobacteria bacterium]